MKARLIFFCLFSALFSQAQDTLLNKYTKPNNTYGLIYNRVYTPFALTPALDTLSDAPMGSIAFKNHIMFYRDTIWKVWTGSGGGFDGNNYPDSIRFTNNTLTLYRHGISSIVASWDSITYHSTFFYDTRYAPYVHGHLSTDISDFTTAARNLLSGGTGISYNPATGVIAWTGSSSGITSFNGLTGTTQTLATGTSGTDFNISSVGTAHTFNIPTASASNRGLLSSTDWTTFNNKLSSVDTTNISNFSTKVRSLFSGTAPISYSNGVIGISQATTSTNGYLSSTDWNTFNNKIGSSDTANKWINDIRRRPRTDSVEKFKNGSWQFAYKDSSGGSSVSTTPLTLTDASTVTWDYSISPVAKVTLGGNRTLSVSNVPDGQVGVLKVKQDATGSRTLTLPGISNFTLSTAANAENVLQFVNYGGTLYWTADVWDASAINAGNFAQSRTIGLIDSLNNRFIGGFRKNDTVFLQKWNGTSVVSSFGWKDSVGSGGGGGSAAGATGNVQINSSGSFAGSNNLHFASNTLSISDDGTIGSTYRLFVKNNAGGAVAQFKPYGATFGSPAFDMPDLLYGHEVIITPWSGGVGFGAYSASDVHIVTSHSSISSWSHSTGLFAVNANGGSGNKLLYTDNSGTHRTSTIDPALIDTSLYLATKHDIAGLGGGSVTGTPGRIALFNQTTGALTDDADLTWTASRVNLRKDTTVFGPSSANLKVIKASVLPTTSYANSGGTGDRTASITATTDLTGGGTISHLVNGTNTTDFSFYWDAQSAAGHYLQFDFGVGANKYIDTILWYQQTTQTHGTWKIQASNDASTWDDVSSNFTFGGVATQTISLSPLAGYRYYRFLGVSGTTNNPYLYEAEFKIADGSSISSKIKAQTYQSGTTTGILSFQPDGGSVEVPIIPYGDSSQKAVPSAVLRHILDSVASLGGSTPTLQQVTVAGNTTNQDMGIDKSNGAMSVTNTGAGVGMAQIGLDGSNNGRLKLRENNGNATVYGIIDANGLTAAQTLHMPDKSGTIAVTSQMAKTLSSQYTDASNTSTTETNLLSYTLPANTLSTVGDRIVIEAMFTTPSNGNSKSMTLYFGGFALVWTSSTIANGATIFVRATIYKTGSNTQRIQIERTTGYSDFPSYTTGSENDSGSILIKFTGTGAASNDITQRTMSVTYYPAQ